MLFRTLSVILFCGIAALAQQSTADILKTVDQLVEQNRQLEQQNKQLMEQIVALRQTLAASPTAAPPAVPQADTSAAGASSSSQSATDDDDKSLLPQSTGGNLWIFGEFNPGRGFTVAKGPYGLLNLSGYMAARYLNQLPPDQSATDHLGRPIAVEPRQDFQFHRVMLFTQGWLFTPKFQ